MRVIEIGFGNAVVTERIVAIVSPDSKPMIRLREDARQSRKLIDATHGRKTKAFIITDSDHLILSSYGPEVLHKRLEATG